MKMVYGEVPYLIGMYPRGLTLYSLYFRNIFFVTSHSFKPLASGWNVGKKFIGKIPGRNMKIFSPQI